MTKSDFTNTSKLLLQKLLVFALLLFYGATTKSQDTIVVLSAKQFDKFDQLGIAAYKGWVYHAGNNKAWAQKEVNTSAWQKRNPFDVNAKDANKTGRAEGWFRIKVRIDSSLASKALKMSFSSYAATDVFINGVHLYSSGNSGLFGGAYKEEIRRTPQLYALNFKPGVDYVIALHIVDYLTPLNPFRLKSEGSHSLGIITPEAVTKSNEFRATIANICIITLTTSVLLTGLFWFLYFSNRTEKNLLIISLALSFCAIFYTSVFLYNVSVEMHTTTAVWYYTLLNVSYCLYILCSLIILVRIFNRRLSKGLLAVFFLIVVLWCVNYFFNMPLPTIVVFSFTGLYYIITSWKKAKGAQRSVIFGVLVSFIGPLLLEFARIELSLLLTYIAFLVMSLSFPLSLLVYVALRFKETLKQVIANTQEILQLSEEKKEQALRQQQILEAEVARQTIEIRTSLTNLKSTQSQLIQSEKMASLGELTAGIAHEIQNPLNFVNNFSDVNTDLLNELEMEAIKGNMDDVRALAKDIKINEQKINHHGKRADAIVKGMLQHSRNSSGQKEPTDINALVDEYLRLAYHGLHAKDKHFKTTLKKNYDQSIDTVNIIPQDIGRVILNLFNNAFYTVDEKHKQQKEGYQPTVSITTKKTDQGVQIIVADNGNGIPQNILNKIFQPFFTTKPTGQGTGLGLSLSYDIIKAHGGELKVETKEGEGAEFIIQLSSNEHQ